MYYLLNDKTLTNYNQTFDVYNELNHFYDNVKYMNIERKEFQQSNELSYYQEVATYKKMSDKALKKVSLSARNEKQKEAFLHLKTLFEVFNDSIQSTDTVEQIESIIHENYLNIMKTRGDYYEIATENMQLYKNEVNQNRDKLAWMSILMVVFIILWIIYFSKAMIHAITNPIELIIHNINQIKMGTYDLTQISNTNEEMNVLCLALEDMAKSVQKNIHNELENAELEKRYLAQQNENLKKDEQLAQGELKILQNQVNPHFLFNTLNLIYKKAYSEGAYETSELMEKTSQLLRYCLDNANKVSTLDKEIKAVENYMFIQDKRFGDRIAFVLHEDDEVANIQMPTMILQPLVENAVLHGCKDIMEDGTITVSINKQEHAISLSVKDNGKGMAKNDVDCMMRNEYRIQDEQREHIGLYNITRRLINFYGDRVNIYIESDIECGFEIRILIQWED